MKRILGLSLVSLVAGVLSVVSPSAATATQRAAAPEPAAATTSQPKTDQASVFESEQRLLRARHVPLPGESDVAATMTTASRTASASAPGPTSPRRLQPPAPCPGASSSAAPCAATSTGCRSGDFRPARMYG